MNRLRRLLITAATGFAMLTIAVNANAANIANKDQDTASIKKIAAAMHPEVVGAQIAVDKMNVKFEVGAAAVTQEAKKQMADGRAILNNTNLNAQAPDDVGVQATKKVVNLLMATQSAANNTNLAAQLRC